MKTLKLQLSLIALTIALTSNAQPLVNAKVDHVIPDGRSNAGRIITQVSGGIAPYSYQWSTGSSEKDLLNAPRGTYALTVKDAASGEANYYYNLGYKCQWTDFNGTRLSNDSLFPEGVPPAGWYYTASGINTLRRNTDGWIEYVIQEHNNAYFVGFTAENSPGQVSDIVFGFYISETNALYSTWGGNISFLSYLNPGDVVRVNKEGVVFSILKNNEVKYASELDVPWDLKVKAIVNDGVLMNLGLSFADSTSIAPLHVKSTLHHLKINSPDNSGRIILEPAGGSSPYSYRWHNEAQLMEQGLNNLTEKDLINIPKGKYAVTVTDYNQDSSVYVCEIGHTVKWNDFDNARERNDSLVMSPIAQPNDPATAISENILRAGANGWIEYKVQPFQNPYMIGFVDPNSSYTEYKYDNIYFGFYIGEDNSMYCWNKGELTFIKYCNPGDVLRLSRNENIYYFDFGDRERGPYTMDADDSFSAKKIKAYISGGSLGSVGCSFSKPLQVGYVKNNIKSADQPGSGSIELMPKYGQEPYTFLWSHDNSELRSINNLEAGNYEVTVKDALMDEVNLSITISNELGWVDVSNMSLDEYGNYKVIDDKKPGAASINGYAEGRKVGFYEFNVVNADSRFNLALTPYSPDAGLVSQAAVVVKRSVVNVSRKSLPDKNSEAFTYIDIIDPTAHGDSLQVVKKEFIQYGCNACEPLPISGIECYYGAMYTLINGVSINKGIPVSNGDLLKIDWENGLFRSYKNGVIFSSGTYSSDNPFIIRGTFESAFGPRGPYGDMIKGPVTISTGGGGGLVLPRDGCGGSCPENSTMNWTETILFDESGGVISSSREYLNYRGLSKQVQTKNFTNGKIIVTQSLYDAYGRTVGRSLPAPVDQQCFCYKPDFIMRYNSNDSYDYTDFDVPDFTGNAGSLTAGERDKPKPVKANTPYNLGWYYSDANSWEGYVPTASTPYTRVVYSKVKPSTILKVTKAGDKLNCGSGHEAYSFKMATVGELNNMFGVGAGWRIDEITNFNTTLGCDNLIKPVLIPSTDPISLKSIMVDENGIENISFYDLTGNLIAKCLSGAVNGTNQKTQSVQGFISFKDESRRYLDIHLPKGCENSLSIEPQPNASFNPPAFRIIDMKTGEYVKFNGAIDIGGVNNNPITPNLSPGYYRIMLSAFDLNYYTSSWASVDVGVAVKQNLNYYNFSINYYDYANRLKASISPNGFDNSYVPESSYHEITPSPLGISVIASVYNNPPNFAEGKTWSFNPETFVNTIPLTLGNLAANTDHNVRIGLTISDRAESRFATGENLQENVLVSKGNNFEPGPQNPVIAPKGIPADSIIVSEKEVPFYIRAALVDERNELMQGTILTSSDLRCTIKYTESGTEYHSWNAAKIVFNLSHSTNEIAVAAPWKNLKVLDLHPATYDLNMEHLERLLLELVISTPQARLSSNTPPARRMPEMFRYDSWSQVVNKSSHDDGITDFIYTEDGKTKLIQNAKQDNSGSATFANRRYSFMLHDIVNRPLMKGEYDPALVASGANRYYFESYQENIYATSPIYGGVYHKALNTLPDVYNASNINLLSAGSTENVYMAYDSPDPNFNSEVGAAITALPTVYTQRHLGGRLSYSYNNNKKTWYSYDEQGRVEWVVQKYIGVNPSSGASPTPDLVKSYRYTYNAAGNVNQTIYNEEDAADRLYHTYHYDADSRLSKTYTRRSTTTPQVLQAAYTYYMHGPLKRAEIGDGMQGLDYVYTINGWLKTINGPEMDRDNLLTKEMGYDPGFDGYEGLYFKDLFGLALDYYYDDYTRDGTNIQGYGGNLAPDQFNGIIKAQRWQTRTAGFSGLRYSNQHLIYRYQYDKLYQLTKATFGPVASNGSQNVSGSPAFGYMQTIITNDYMVDDITYDYNGNLMHLKRKAYGSNDPVTDDLTYIYGSCSNQLLSATDAITAQTYGLLEFKPGQTNNITNYLYNEIGELTSEKNDDKKYTYNSAGNITAIRKFSNNNLIAEYKYDEGGMRIEKIDYVNSQRTLYIRDIKGQIITTFVKSGTGNTVNYSVPEQWNIYAANRIGVLDNTGTTPAYIYELSDHLGNVRATFKKSVYTTISTNYDTNVNPSWFDYNYSVVSSFYNGPSTPGNNFIFTQNVGSAGGSGPGSKLIKVKYGDNITVSFTSYFHNSPAPVAGVKVEFLNRNGQHLYYVTQYSNGMATSNAVPGISIPCTGTPNNWNPSGHTFNVNLNFPEMYIRIYPYNAAGGAIVYFDDMSITFNNGGSVSQPDMLTMADYYPHGGVMPGLNYNNSYNYRNGYQGQFAEKDKESNESFFELRNYDPLLGRFKTTDPYHQYWSPYVAMGNNHPNLVDPNGGQTEDWFWNTETHQLEFIFGATSADHIAGYEWFGLASDPSISLLTVEVTAQYTAAEALLIYLQASADAENKFPGSPWFFTEGLFPNGVNVNAANVVIDFGGRIMKFDEVTINIEPTDEVLPVRYNTSDYSESVSPDKGGLLSPEKANKSSFTYMQDGRTILKITSHSNQSTKVFHSLNTWSGILNEASYGNQVIIPANPRFPSVSNRK